MIGRSDELTADAKPLLRGMRVTENDLAGVWQSAYERIPWAFAIIVVVPTLLTAIYMFLIASPIYVSETQFVVQTSSGRGPSTIGMMLASVGFEMGAASQSYEVNEYLLSRAAVHNLADHHDLRGILDRPGADFLARFPRFFERDSFENLYDSYQRFVSVNYDSTTGINTLRVRAFSPQDAYDLASALLDTSETLLNQLNDRALNDATEEAWGQVARAQKRALSAEDALTGFRTREKLIDPTQASAAGTGISNQLNGQIATLEAERSSLGALAPESPALPDLDERIRSLKAQSDLERMKVAGVSNSLAPLIGEYERLTLERDFATKDMENADAALQQAQIDARKKQAYIDKVVPPNIPDQAEYPSRFTNVVVVFVSAFILYATIMLIAAGLREHRQS
jgi:capsular polysaccharide transport system permease protein